MAVFHPMNPKRIPRPDEYVSERRAIFYAKLRSNSRCNRAMLRDFVPHITEPPVGKSPAKRFYRLKDLLAFAEKMNLIR